MGMWLLRVTKSAVDQPKNAVAMLNADVFGSAQVFKHSPVKRNAAETNWMLQNATLSTDNFQNNIVHDFLTVESSPVDSMI